MEMKSHRTGFVPSEESVIDLGLLTFPTDLLEYIRSGPTFDPDSYLAATADVLVQNLSTSRIGEDLWGVDGGLCLPSLQRPLTAFHPLPFPAAIENYKVLKSEAQRSGEVVLKLASEAAASKKGKQGPSGSGGRIQTAASREGPNDPVKKKLDEDIEKLRDLLVSTHEGSTRHRGMKHVRDVSYICFIPERSLDLTSPPTGCESLVFGHPATNEGDPGQCVLRARSQAPTPLPAGQGREGHGRGFRREACG